MAQVLDSILQFFYGIGMFLENIINGIIQLVQIIPQAMAFMATALGSLPSIIATFALAMITVSIVYLVVGR